MLDAYRRCPEHLYAFLPDDKEIGADTLRQWREAMRAEERTTGALNIHISAANSWLDFLGRKEFHLKLLLRGNPQKTEMPALT